ncbi:hypothetical protein A7D21_28230 [Pseudomonas sp. AP19]|uniref:hypothetical protein n=1 Tax=Pseudomonas TaxID=286 RepID=UPI00084B36AD|nr:MULTISPECIES: hypothetical protein [Pseudomonas]MBC8785608.1 hypothetical protein [Pseudomonas fluorescens]OEC67925.1 hypothetical protein A7D21_28230 [Pseudomonas sp. AP19]
MSVQQEQAVEMDSEKAAELVAGIIRSGVVIANERWLVGKLGESGEPARNLRFAIFSAGEHGVTFDTSTHGIDFKALVRVFTSVISEEESEEAAHLLMANLQSRHVCRGSKVTTEKVEHSDNLEGWRKLVRHYYGLIVILCLAILTIIGVYAKFNQFTVVALAMYPPLTSAWYYSTPEVVHGPSFRKMNRAAQINTMLRIAGLFMSAAAFINITPKLF